MGGFLVFLFIVAVLILIAYLKFPPRYAKKKAVHIYDATVVGICAFLCFIWIMHTYDKFVGTDNNIWWTSIAAIGALGIESVFLGIGFLMRNFWIFKPPSRPGTGLF